MKAAIITFICVGLVVAVIASFYAMYYPNSEPYFDAVIIFLVLFYFLPAIAAKGSQHGMAIFILNLLLGWTLLGWVAALVWAAASPKKQKPFALDQQRFLNEVTR